MVPFFVVGTLFSKWFPGGAFLYPLLPPPKKVVNKNEENATQSLYCAKHWCWLHTATLTKSYKNSPRIEKIERGNRGKKCTRSV